MSLNFIIVIPALNPDEKLIQLLTSIRSTVNEIPIIIINDGSSNEYLRIFEQAKQYDCIVKNHKTNKGKGVAIKTAIKYIQKKFPSIDSLITVDSDGQHTVLDIVGCMETARKNPEALVLGTRTFGRNIPLRSKFGNIVTRNILKMTTGIALEDTQTGLRIIPRTFFDDLLLLEGDRYEFETNMLIATRESEVPVVSHPISTIYINGNKSSHFKVFSDSVRIYSVFFKYIISSILAFIIDISVYAILVRILFPIGFFAIYLSSFFARVISALFNYTLNKRFVFRNNSHLSMFKYFSLAIMQIILSSFFIHFLSFLFSTQATVLLKIIIDSMLFLVSYFIQKKIIFKG
ncbi:hypothetical protein BW727_101209 [Jeotgalibaca dankookensis]|uniref:Glycosyltransferase n=1 Tax=Jeotgalibaca dankookensis TaxID=708126 RepID=A0A1S6IPU7_9LACT|nr:bifunctional glycosyltransferase family 2/GtrA family protein [Jeotgalibaca dankookensis]AQS53576.1 hypothetical protein BW727_101209 [Jeotgalibaca dankookensis]